jgi:hypothetical protein
MPQVFSRLVLLSIFIVFLQWLKTKNNYLYIPLVLLASSLFGFKVYYGLYFITGLGFFTLYYLITQYRDLYQKQKNIFSSLKKTITNNKYLLISWIAIAILSAAIFLPNNKNAGGLQLEPLAWPKIFLSSENFNYKDWWLRMQVYEEAKNIRNITIFNTIAVLITLVSVYGVRLFGFFPNKNSSENFPKEFLWFLIPTNIIFVIIGFTYFQVSISGGLNIYNFLITPVLAFNMFLAFYVSNNKHALVRATLIALIVAFCIPRSFLQLQEYFNSYYSQRPSQVVSHDELELFSYLKQKDSTAVIQGDIRNEYENIAPYISFFADKSTYIGGIRLLETHNVHTKERQKQVQDMYDSNDVNFIAQTMKELNIQYLYVTHQGFADKFLEASAANSPLIVEKQNTAGVVVSAK